MSGGASFTICSSLWPAMYNLVYLFHATASALRLIAMLMSLSWCRSSAWTLVRPRVIFTATYLSILAERWSIRQRRQPRCRIESCGQLVGWLSHTESYQKGLKSQPVETHDNFGNYMQQPMSDMSALNFNDSGNIQHVPRWTSVIEQAHIPMNIHQSQTNIRSLANFYGASNHKFKAMFHLFIHRQHDHNMWFHCKICRWVRKLVMLVSAQQFK